MELPITFITSLLEIETSESVLYAHLYLFICVLTIYGEIAHCVFNSIVGFFLIMHSATLCLVVCPR